MDQQPNLENKLANRANVIQTRFQKQRTMQPCYQRENETPSTPPKSKTNNQPLSSLKAGQNYKRSSYATTTENLKIYSSEEKFKYDDGSMHRNKDNVSRKRSQKSQKQLSNERHDIEQNMPALRVQSETIDHLMVLASLKKQKESFQSVTAREAASVSASNITGQYERQLTSSSQKKKDRHKRRRKTDSYHRDSQSALTNRHIVK